MLLPACDGFGFGDGLGLLGVGLGEGFGEELTEALGWNGSARDWSVPPRVPMYAKIANAAATAIAATPPTHRSRSAPGGFAFWEAFS